MSSELGSETLFQLIKGLARIILNGLQELPRLRSQCLVRCSWALVLLR